MRPWVREVAGAEPLALALRRLDRGREFGLGGAQPGQAVLRSRELGHPLLAIAVEPGSLAKALDLEIKAGQRRGDSLGFAVDPRQLGPKDRDLSVDDLARPGRRRDLRQAEEAEWIVPRLSDRPGAGVLRSGRSALAGQTVARVETPQAAVAVDPADVVADDDRRPFDVGARPDGEAVASGIVDERD